MTCGTESSRVTVRRLYLLRHAKSDWDALYGSDHDRPLSARGRRAASTVGRFLGRQPQPPQTAVSSTAVRARNTIEIALQDGGLRCRLRLDDRLYGASVETLLAVAWECEDESSSLILVGHEPTWSAAAGRLVGSAEIRMVTGSLARIDLPIESWRDARWGSGSLRWLVTPKLLQRFGG